MPSMPSQDYLNALITDPQLLAALVHDAIAAAAPFVAAGAGQSLLALVPVAGGFEDFEQDVEIRLCEPAQFLRVRDAWEAHRVRFAVRSLSSAPPPLAIVGGRNVERGLFGFVENYGVICVRRHPRLDCVTFQFC